jgi:hypothetical protein
MPSKRSRAWKRRKLAAEAEARLKGEYHEWVPPPGFEELKKTFATAAIANPYREHKHVADPRQPEREGDPRD